TETDRATVLPRRVAVGAGISPRAENVPVPADLEVCTKRVVAEAAAVDVRLAALEIGVVVIERLGPNSRRAPHEAECQHASHGASPHSTDRPSVAQGGTIRTSAPARCRAMASVAHLAQNDRFPRARSP